MMCEALGSPRSTESPTCRLPPLVGGKRKELAMITISGRLIRISGTHRGGRTALSARLALLLFVTLKLSSALAAAMAALVLVYTASPAHAAGACSTTSSGNTTCTYGPTGSEDTFVVRAGVSKIHVVATGAPGDGRGARV